MSKVLAIDIGGTSIKYAIMGEKMEILSKGKVPTPQEGREQLVNALASIYEQEPVEGIAISMPGIINTEKGLCLMGGALRYNDNFNLRAALAERCPVPIHIENDAKCAAMAEAAMGSLKDVKRLCISLTHRRANFPGQRAEYAPSGAETGRTAKGALS